MSAVATKPRLTPFERAQKYVAKMEAAIQNSGGDNQTFIVACKLVEFGLPASDAMTIFREFNARCDPPWDDHGLERKLAAAYRTAKPKPEFTGGTLKPIPNFTPTTERAQTWPEENKDKRADIVAGGIGLADLSSMSPAWFEAGANHTVEILKTIFPGNPLVCCGRGKWDFWTKPLRDYGRSVEKLEFVVSSPMSKLTGKPKDKYGQSAHTLDNTGPRKYAVVEFDQGSSDEHAALLWHLSDYAPFVMAVHSGGKSLHGWFRVTGAPDDQVKRFYQYAVSIGADRATSLKSQFVRMPDGLRSNGNRQPVYYFNPEAITDAEQAD